MITRTGTRWEMGIHAGLISWHGVGSSIRDLALEWAGGIQCGIFNVDRILPWGSGRGGESRVDDEGWSVSGILNLDLVLTLTVTVPLLLGPALSFPARPWSSLLVHHGVDLAGPHAGVVPVLLLLLPVLLMLGPSGKSDRMMDGVRRVSRSIWVSERNGIVARGVLVIHRSSRANVE
jgi:hypothetical protein